MRAIIMYSVRDIAKILNKDNDNKYMSIIYEALFQPEYDDLVFINRCIMLVKITYFRKEISRLEQLGDQENAIKRVNEYITVLG